MIGRDETGIQRRPFMVVAIAVTAAAILAICLAASRGVAEGPEATPSPHATEYLPSISDLMIATIQPRHERLWQAEQDGNWEFAAYELGNLRGAFNRTRARPSQRTRHLPSGHDHLRYGATVQGTQQRDPIQRRHRIWQGLCRSDRRMQFMSSGSQPQRGRSPRTEPNVYVGPKRQQPNPELTLGMPPTPTARSARHSEY